MIKLIIKKYITLYEFIKQIKKGKYDNTTRFIVDDKEYDIDEYFKNHHCNLLTLNEEIQILDKVKE
jgi:hypothetical protein